MTRSVIPVVLLVIAGLGGACTSLGQAAADRMDPAAPQAHKTLHVLTEAQLDPSRLLPPPFKDGSDEQKAELVDVQKAYKRRTPERRAQAEWDDKHESVELFFDTLGAQFDLKKLPVTARLLEVVENEQSVAVNIAKRHFLRNRPWAIDHSLIACDYKPNANPLSSYPSGHATLGYAEGLVLAELMPEKAQAILTRAREYAYSRVVCGAHYASDLEASHVLATELVMLMMRDPKFAAEVDASRAELRAAGLTR
jgi:acid phosphatase (class A)